VFFILCLLAGLFFSINIINFYFYRDTGFLLASSYYLFNTLAFSTTVILFKSSPETVRRWARYIILVTLFVQLLILKLSGGFLLREVGTFNNPNQLGYWSLLSASCLLVLNYGRRMPLIDIIALCVATYLVAESLSRAALLSHLLVLMAFFLGSYVGWLMKLGVMIALFVYALLQISLFSNPGLILDNLELVNEVSERIDTIQTEEGVVKERGYGRLQNYPFYMLYGAGEGAFWRFNEKTEPQHQGLELHSGLASILISYGIFGFLLFCAFVFTVFQRVPWLLWLTLAAVMGYGVTHQHVRFTSFWIYMGLVYGMSRYVLVDQRKRLQLRQEESLQ
jgi:hypothetical protein